MNSSSGSPENTARTAQTILISSVLSRSASVIGRRFWSFYTLQLVLAAGLLGIGALVSRLVIGDNVGPVDPRVLPFTMGREQWAIVGVGVFLTALVVFFSIGATIHLASAAVRKEPLSAMAAFGKVKFESLWLLWIQMIASMITVAIFPFAGLVLWLLIASAIPVAVLERLLPNRALDRAWALMEGSRIQVLLLEVILTLLTVVALTIVQTAFYQPDSLPGFLALPALARYATAWPLTALILIPVAFLFVGLTVTYHTLLARKAPETLHAQSASNVN